jgi:hypothetical protein
MAYKFPFMRLSLSGTIYDVEQFAIGLTLAHVGNGTPTVPGTVPQGIIDACIAFFEAAPISSHAKLKLIKYNQIGVDGKYVDKTNTVSYDVTTLVAGSSSSTPPAQLAQVISLRTGVLRGLAHAGRFYLPLPISNLGTTGLVASGDITDLMTVVDDFLNAINAVSADWRVAVVSNVRAGAEHFVTHARIGRVLDTMRSRRAKLDEEYVDGSTLTVP